MSKLGDEGQRYEVHATNLRGKDVVIGWTNRSDGGEIVRAVGQDLTFDKPRVVDRFPGIEKLIALPFKAGCRKCVEQIYAGKDACSYCNMRFRRPESDGEKAG